LLIKYQYKELSLSFRLKAGDIILIIVVLIIGIASPFLLFGKSDKVTAQIIKDKKIIQSISLDDITSPVSYEVDGDYINHITAEKGRIRFSSSDCPDDICVQTGWISRPGQTAVCLPNGVIIKIVGKNNSSDTDAILN
jgi:hypothetical protein